MAEAACAARRPSALLQIPDWSEANEKIALLEKKLEESEATLARKSNDLK